MATYTSRSMAEPDDDYWTAEELSMSSLNELKSIAMENGIPYRYNATRAELVALLCGEEYVPPPPTPEDMMREATQLHSWVRGVPPGESLLTADDKLWLSRMFNVAV